MSFVAFFVCFFMYFTVHAAFVRIKLMIPVAHWACNGAGETHVHVAEAAWSACR